MSSYDTLITNGNDVLAAHIKAVMPPIGSILPWAKSITGTPSLLAGYVECSGQVLSDADSPLNGDTIPNLNGNNNFLRGATTSGGTGGSATHGHTMGGPSSTNTLDNYGSPDIATNTHQHPIPTATNLPVYVNVVWIMRVK